MRKLSWVICVLVVSSWQCQLSARCLDFFEVKRPVAPLVLHEYIAAASPDGEIHVFGLPKADADRLYFDKWRRHGTAPGGSVVALGSACGTRAEGAFEAARERSADWQRRYARWLPFLGRMAVTPLLGKPCRRASQDVLRHVRPWLH